ncbi:MAG: hypothetical protein ACREQ8_14915 [Woeseiaceae bacterium]
MFEHPPIPTHLLANQTASWIFLAFTAVAFAATLLWALRRAIVSADRLPLILLAGGVLCGFLEPMGDILGATYYPTNTPLLVWEMFGRQIPLFVFVGEGMFFATAVYGAYRLYLAGTSIQKLISFMLLFSAFDAAMEMTSIHFNVMTYYGNNPVLVLGLPLYSIVQNGALAIVLGWIVLILSSKLKGEQAVWIAPLIPLAFGLQALVTTWPMYLGLNSEFSTTTMLALGLLATAANLALPLYVLNSRRVRDLRGQGVAISRTAPATVP